MFNLSVFIAGGYYLLLARIVFLILNFLLMIYLFIVYKQVGSMDNIVEDVNVARILRSSAFALFAIAVSLFLIVLFMPQWLS